MTGHPPLGAYDPAARCRLLMNRDGNLNEGTVLTGESLPVPDISGSAGKTYLYISEILLRASKHQRSTWDFLCLVSVEAPEGETLANRVHVIGPSAIRSHASVVPAGLLISEIPVAVAPAPQSRLTAGAFRIPRTPESRRIVTTIEKLAASLDYATDPLGSTAVASSIVDRLELLLRPPEASMLAGGSRTCDHGADYWHVTFFPPAGPVPDRVFQVRDSRLWAGQSQASVSPWREQEFLLLRVGPRAERSEAIRSIDELRRLHAVTQTIAVETGVEEEKYGEKIARTRLLSRLTTRFGRAGMQRLPVVTPIAIEAAADLGPILMGDDGGLHPVFGQQLGGMRAELRHVLGFEVPTARIRMNDSDMPPGSYLFMFHEVPLVMGTVKLGSGLCAATVEAVSSLGINAEPGTNPSDQNESSWVAEADWQRLMDAGLQVLPPAAYIILHLNAAIRRNLPEFVTLDAVASMLRSNSREQYDEIRSAAGELSRFTSVIQGLLAEEVSIGNLDVVCRRYLEQRHLPAYEIVEEIRALDQIRTGLPGNAPDHPVLRLGEKFTALLRDGIRQYGEATILALEPEPTQQALSAVRTEFGSLPPNSRSPVLFVEDWRMRPFVRKLVELEFPRLWTLSRREAISPDSMPVIATVEYEEPKTRWVKK